jgi:hypothetical protein
VGRIFGFGDLLWINNFGEFAILNTLNDILAKRGRKYVNLR